MQEYHSSYIKLNITAGYDVDCRVGYTFTTIAYHIRANP